MKNKEPATYLGKKASLAEWSKATGLRSVVHLNAWVRPPQDAFRWFYFTFDL